MLTKIGLEGQWKLQLDARQQGFKPPFSDTMNLPGTTSHARKGPKNEERLERSLTDEYLFEGSAWFEREVDIPDELAESVCLLYLERTRMTAVWVDGQEAGSRDSLNAPHVYDLTGLIRSGRQTVTIRVDNVGYPTKGGHMTSPDTQTNWNGITGRLELQFFGESRLDGVRLEPVLADKLIRISGSVTGKEQGTRLTVTASSFNGETVHETELSGYSLPYGTFRLDYALGAEALLWSEAEPNLYKVTLTLEEESGKALDRQELIFGLREFTAEGDKFAINGRRTFLRGKHDGLIFPLTGYAPTDVEEWLRILGISKSYGMNHYRFHTCCPPEAAFTAADMLGIYMEPELPFWGTITEPGEEGHNQAEQDYLIREGYRMLEAFGNHPSFVMMSLGNELWGSRKVIDGILKDYKAFDGRPLYTQGSNNHQWRPAVLEHEDFFCGVRFSKERLFRGSYAMCDAPLGHVQTALPGTMKDYDDQFVASASAGAESGAAADGTIQIQYGTEAKTVQATDAAEDWVPQIPVVSHEIGQYATFPDFDEIGKYSGPLKARNFEIFRERLEQKGMGHLAKPYFENSGRLAVECYKEELEAAFRSRKLAGFQLLDLQDFSGQGTALVGVLDAFMDSKGLVSPEEWRTFCSDAVLLARFPKYNYAGGETFKAHAELTWYRREAPGALTLHWSISGEGDLRFEGSAQTEAGEDAHYIDLCDVEVELPDVQGMTKVVLELHIEGTDIRKSYDLWIYPAVVDADLSGVPLFKGLEGEALAQLEQGGDVLLMPDPETLVNAVEGFYSTDFWCYPMFRSISESMNRPVPVGTMGLLIDNAHPALAQFPSETHSTYSWWNVVSHSKSIIMDEAGAGWSPIVQTIDNFERNHKLGFLFECRVGKGRLLVCPLDADQAGQSPEGRQFLSSLKAYMTSDAFNPSYEASPEELLKLIR